MSIPFSAPPPAPIPPVTAPANVALNLNTSPVIMPLEFMIVTSRHDFGMDTHRFANECERLGIQSDIVYIEDLEGHTAGEKLTHLHKLNADWKANGKVVNSTIKCLLLHGQIDAFPDDESLEEFYVDTLGYESGSDSGDEDSGISNNGKDNAASEEYDSDTLVSSDDESDVLVSSDEESGHDEQKNIEIHCAYAGNLVIPTHYIDLALRHFTWKDGIPKYGFRKTIIYGPCFSGNLRDIVKPTGASYVLTTGKKTGLTWDFFDGLALLAREAANRKHEKQRPMSGRDCWMLMRNVTGEHISYVGENSVEVHKVLETAHSEPVLSAQDTYRGRRANNILAAKIIHGSADSLQRAIDMFDDDLTLDFEDITAYKILAGDSFHDEKELRKKLDMLLAAGINIPGAPEDIASILHACITRKNWRLLSLLLDQDMPMIDSSDASSGNLIARLFEWNSVLENRGGLAICKQLEQLGQDNHPMREVIKQALFAGIQRYRKAGCIFELDTVPQIEKLVVEAALDNFPDAIRPLKPIVLRELARDVGDRVRLVWLILWSKPVALVELLLERCLESGWRRYEAKILLNCLENVTNDQHRREIIDHLFGKALLRKNFDFADSLIPYGGSPKSLLQSPEGNRLYFRILSEENREDLNEVRAFFRKHHFSLKT
jgi:hypothetical protein